MIQETGPNHPTSLYIYTDQNSYEPLARIDKRGNDPERVMYFHTDLNGCPEELTDENGEILWECSFQLWGKRIHEIEHESIEQNLRYQGQYLDRETGLHYNTFRYYDPDIGRFTQPDPIGLLGGFNLYQYAPNGLTWVDPWGWAKCPITSGSQVTPSIVKKALKGDTMQTTQGTVSLPAVQRYVDRLLQGDTPPPIKVDGNVIVEGNHRYVAGKIVGVLPPKTQGTLAPSNIPKIKPMSETKVDLFDWGNY
ncbi:hypothetical protein A9G44_03010 [Gilliamella sp. Occ4-3]|nr:hypothetical protein A9G44_03010 [Gilliamella apicola]